VTDPPLSAGERTLLVVHSIPGAIAGDLNRAEFYDFTTRTEVPFSAALNTPNSQPFSVEAWLSFINAHRTPTTLSISIAKSGANYVITYAGTLVSSPTVNGQYNTVSGATSPYTVPAGTRIMFYRVSSP
jgi:hypothetical protein